MDTPSQDGSRLWPILVVALIVILVGSIVLFSRERRKWGSDRGYSIIDPDTSTAQESLSAVLPGGKPLVPKGRREESGPLDERAKRAVEECLPEIRETARWGFPKDSDALLSWLGKSRGGVARREIRSRAVWMTLPKGQKRHLRLYRPDDESEGIRIRLDFLAEDPLGKLILLPIPQTHSENPSRPVIVDYLGRGVATREDWSYRVWYPDGSGAEVDETNGAVVSIHYRAPGLLLACERYDQGKGTTCSCNRAAPKKK